MQFGRKQSNASTNINIPWSTKAQHNKSVQLKKKLIFILLKRKYGILNCNANIKVNLIFPDLLNTNSHSLHSSVVGVIGQTDNDHGEVGTIFFGANAFIEELFDVDGSFLVHGQSVVAFNHFVVDLKNISIVSDNMKTIYFICNYSILHRIKRKLFNY